MRYKNIEDCKGKEIYVRDLIEEMQQNEKSIDSIAEQIAILSHPQCYKSSFVIDRDIEYPEDLLKEIFYSFKEAPGMQRKIRKALEKLIIEWQEQDQWSIKQLEIYLDLISSFRIQSTNLYDWLIQNAKKGLFKNVHSEYYNSTLHLLILNLLFFYVRPSIEANDMKSEEKLIIRRDIKEKEYTHICFRRAWYISWKFAEELLSEYFKTAVLKGNEEKSFLFQWRDFIESLDTNTHFMPAVLNIDFDDAMFDRETIEKLIPHVKDVLHLYLIPIPNSTKILVAIKWDKEYNNIIDEIIANNAEELNTVLNDFLSKYIQQEEKKRVVMENLKNFILRHNGDDDKYSFIKELIARFIKSIVDITRERKEKITKMDNGEPWEKKTNIYKDVIHGIFNNRNFKAEEAHSYGG